MYPSVERFVLLQRLWPVQVQMSERVERERYQKGCRYYLVRFAFRSDCHNFFLVSKIFLNIQVWWAETLWAVSSNLKISSGLSKAEGCQTLKTYKEIFKEIREALKKKRDYLGIFPNMGGGVFPIPKLKTKKIPLNHPLITQKTN